MRSTYPTELFSVEGSKHWDLCDVVEWLVSNTPAVPVLLGSHVWSLQLTLPCRPYGIENSGLVVVLECSAFTSGYETPYSYYPTLSSLTSLDSITFAPCERHRIPISQNFRFLPSLKCSAIDNGTGHELFNVSGVNVSGAAQNDSSTVRVFGIPEAGIRPRRIVVTWRDGRRRGAHLILFLVTGPHVYREMERNSLRGKYHIKRGMQGKGTKESYAQRSRISKTGIYMGCTHGEGARLVSVRWGGITMIEYHCARLAQSERRDAYHRSRQLPRRALELKVTVMAD